MPGGGTEVFAYYERVRRRDYQDDRLDSAKWTVTSEVEVMRLVGST